MCSQEEVYEFILIITHMWHNCSSQPEQQDKENTSLSIERSQATIPNHNFVYCCISECQCSQHSQRIPLKYQHKVRFCCSKHCSTIQEVTQPAQTYSQMQMTNKQWRSYPPDAKDCNFGSLMGESGECVSLRIKGKTKSN